MVVVCRFSLETSSIFNLKFYCVCKKIPPSTARLLVYLSTLSSNSGTFWRPEIFSIQFYFRNSGHLLSNIQVIISNVLLTCGRRLAWWSRMYCPPVMRLRAMKNSRYSVSEGSHPTQYKIIPLAAISWHIATGLWLLGQPWGNLSFLRSRPCGRVSPAENKTYWKC